MATSQLARALRLRQTDAERKLWSRLRNRQLAGRQFRRQAPIGPYVVDFVCFAEKLIVEVDGGQHAIDVQKDVIRAEWLGSQGFRVLRFWNNEVLGNVEAVAHAIGQAMKSRED